MKLRSCYAFCRFFLFHLILVIQNQLSSRHNLSPFWCPCHAKNVKCVRELLLMDSPAQIKLDHNRIIGYWCDLPCGGFIMSVYFNSSDCLLPAWVPPDKFWAPQNMSFEILWFATPDKLKVAEKKVSRFRDLYAVPDHPLHKSSVYSVTLSSQNAFELSKINCFTQTKWAPSVERAVSITPPLFRRVEFGLVIDLCLTLLCSPLIKGKCTTFFFFVCS